MRKLKAKGGLLHNANGIGLQLFSHFIRQLADRFTITDCDCRLKASL